MNIPISNKTEESANLLQYWKDWYEPYYYADYPRIIIRYEDLIFHLQYVLSQICQCAGGSIVGKPRIPQHSAKGYQGVEYQGNGLVKAIASIANVTRRINHMTQNDLSFADALLEK